MQLTWLLLTGWVWCSFISNSKLFPFVHMALIWGPLVIRGSFERRVLYVHCHNKSSQAKKLRDNAKPVTCVYHFFLCYSKTMWNFIFSCDKYDWPHQRARKKLHICILVKWCLECFLFVFRADIKQYIGPPSPKAIYKIYHSCIKELVRVSLVFEQLGMQ